LVCLTSGKARKCAAGEAIVGVVSTKPGIVGNDVFDAKHPELTVLVGLLGQIPVKLDLEGGEIHAGDPITAASRPGYGKKAAAISQIVGYAMESFTTASKSDRVPVFVRPQAFISDYEFSSLRADNDNLRSALAAANGNLQREQANAKAVSELRRNVADLKRKVGAP
jgi:hypothetical protein